MIGECDGTPREMHGTSTNHKVRGHVSFTNNTWPLGVAPRGAYARGRSLVEPRLNFCLPLHLGSFLSLFFFGGGGEVPWTGMLCN